MRGDGEVNETMVVSAAVDDGRIEGGPALAAMNHGLSSFGGLAKDSMNIIAILLVSIVLALRRRVLRRGS